MKTGADVLCAALRENGVDCVFGVPGTQTLALYEGVRKSALRSVLTTSELAAGFMANGYHRASGRMAALLTIPGPGFTWALTAVAEALHDSVPMLHLAGRTPSPERTLHLQAIDQRAVAAPLVKGMFRIDTGADVAPETARAIRLARSGEPGPVLVEWTREALEAEAMPRAAQALDESSTAGAPDSQIIALLSSARRPMLLAGQGAAGAAQSLRELAELLDAPVVTTASGRGVLPEDHRLSVGFDVECGSTDVVNDLLESSDAILALGCKLGYSGTGGFQLRLPADRLIRVDTSAEVFDSPYPAKYGVKRSVESFLDALLPELRKKRARANSGFSPEELERSRLRLRQSAADIPEPAVAGTLSSDAAAFFAALRRALPRDGIVVADSGLHQQMLRRHFQVLSARGLVFPSDFQSMGFGLPAAIGAKLGAPERPVVALIGDGGFAMSAMELLTAVREKLSLTLIVLADGLLGRIRLEQLAAFGQTSSIELLNPDFRAFAAAVGADYALCEGDPEPLLRRAISGSRVSVVEVRLRDSLAIERVRAKGLIRGAARRVLSPGLLSTLKRVMRRNA